MQLMFSGRNTFGLPLKNTFIKSDYGRFSSAEGCETCEVLSCTAILFFIIKL